MLCSIFINDFFPEHYRKSWDNTEHVKPKSQMLELDFFFNHEKNTVALARAHRSKITPAVVARVRASLPTFSTCARTARSRTTDAFRMRSRAAARSPRHAFLGWCQLHAFPSLHTQIRFDTTTLVWRLVRAQIYLRTDHHRYYVHQSFALDNTMNKELFQCNLRTLIGQ